MRLSSLISNNLNLVNVHLFHDEDNLVALEQVCNLLKLIIFMNRRVPLFFSPLHATVNTDTEQCITHYKGQQHISIIHPNIYLVI